MAKVDIVRAWKDEEYRISLTEQGAQVPDAPVGRIELEDAEIRAVMNPGVHTVTFPRCCFTF